MKKLSKIINNIIKIFFVVILIFLTITSIFSTCAMNWKEKTQYNQDNWILNIFIILILTIIIVLIKNKKKNISEKSKKIILCVAITIWVVFALNWVLGIKFEPKADQKYILKAALNISKGNFSAFTKKTGYINANPQQEGMLMLEYLISLFARESTARVVQIINVFALLISFYVIYKITDKYFNNKNISKATFILLLMFLPVFFYVTFVYGNIIGLALSMLAVWLEMNFIESKKWRYLCFSAILIGLAVLIKSNFLITLIAMLVMLFINLLEEKKFRNIVGIFAIIIVYLFLNTALKYTVNKMTNSDIGKGIPMSSYVAMGMQTGNRAPRMV